MKKIISCIILLILIIILFIIPFLKTIDNKKLDLTQIIIGNKTITLNSGDSLDVSAWNGLDVEFNDKSYNKFPIIYGGITIGSSVEDVLDIFNIKNGYANINMEVPTPEHDGTTDIVNVLYKNKNFLKYDFLDALIIFGYKKQNDKWVMMEYKELSNILEKEIYNNQEIIVFYIDINGMSHEMVDINEVIAINIEYFN